MSAYRRRRRRRQRARGSLGQFLRKVIPQVDNYWAVSESNSTDG